MGILAVSVSLPSGIDVQAQPFTLETWRELNGCPYHLYTTTIGFRHFKGSCLPLRYYQGSMSAPALLVSLLSSTNIQTQPIAIEILPKAFEYSVASLPLLSDIDTWDGEVPVKRSVVPFHTYTN
jgi:hypothetical protein